MPLQDLGQLLQSNAYPGRGIVLGLCNDGLRAFMAYFIMGRSENSRNRVFTEYDGGVLTTAADPGKVRDPSLILYNAVRRQGEVTIVTNGDQTDTIYEALETGGTFESALAVRTFEPDDPNFTPRISGVLTLGFSGFSYKLSILKSAGGNAASAQRFFFDYPQPLPGAGHFIHTYAANGNPLPSFFGEPVPVALDGELDDVANGIWNSLNAENKISLFARTITLDGDEETRIINKYHQI